jgi:serine/threonine protein kinase
MKTSIIVAHNGRQVAEHMVEPNVYVIGRDPDCAIRIDSANVSRRHAQLIVEPDRVYVEDLGSANGTHLGGVRIQGRTPVLPDQELRIGPVSISVRQILEMAQAQPAAGVAPEAPRPATLAPVEAQPVAGPGSDKYEIGREVARGGMGAVLQARDLMIRRGVAMKVMLDTESPDAMNRFLEEAQVTGQLEHPGIVPVYDLGVDGQGQPFYTMKFVKGVTLEAILDGLAKGRPAMVQRYPLGALLTVFQKVCDALAFAHAKHVIHRDLKPANIMIGDYGEVLVMDWGLAKVLGHSEPAQAAAQRSVITSARRDAGDSSRTMAGTVMGTPHYMAPEQARGEVEQLDPRTDIFSLGAILYHILALQQPFTGKSIDEILAKVERGEAAPIGSKLRPHLPGGRIPDSLLAVVKKALALKPEDRYQSVPELQRDIEAYQNGFATSAENAGAMRQIALLVKRHKAVATASAAALVLIGLISATFTLRVVRERNRATAERDRANSTLAQLKATAPTFFEQARALVEKQDFTGALEKIEFAIALRKNDAEYYCQKGNILESLARIKDALAAYDGALALQKDHAFARENRDLCAEILKEEGGNPELSKASINKINQLMRKQGRTAEAIITLRALGKDRQIVFDTWKKRLAEAGLNTWGDQLALDDDGLFSVHLDARSSLENISFLRGMPMKYLCVSRTKVIDLSPVHDAPLRELNIGGAPVASLEALRGMSLRTLNAGGTKITDLRPLQGMPLEELTLSGCGQLKTLDGLQGLPLKRLTLHFASGIRDISAIRGAPLEYFECWGLFGIRDFSVLAGLPLKQLMTGYSSFRDVHLLKGKQLEELVVGGAFPDLSPLRGMPLTYLDVWDGGLITDLSPLAGLPLTRLRIGKLSGVDLTPLKKLKLTNLTLNGAKGTDFSILAGLPLESLDLSYSDFDELQLLAGKRLKRLNLQNCPISDLSPLRGISVRSLCINGTKATNVNVVADMPDLDELIIPADAGDIRYLRRLTNLRKLDNRLVFNSADVRSAVDFWKDYDKAGAPGTAKP